MFTSNITKERLKVKGLYLNTKARKCLKLGRTNVFLPGHPSSPFKATIREDGLIVYCPGLFSPKTFKPPLAIGDKVVFNVQNGNIHILNVQRGGQSLLLTPQPPASGTLAGSILLADDEEPEEGPEDPGNHDQSPLPKQSFPELASAWDGYLPNGITNDCLSIYRFPCLPDYLALNRHRVIALGAQSLPPWSAGYDTIGGAVMGRLRYAFPTRCITRADLVALFESWHDPVLCLVSAMVWGGIRIQNLCQLLAMGEATLLARMQALRPLVRSGAFEVAFNDCSTGGRLKFNGIGPAFFTKLFYFLGQVPSVLNPAPLILDKWTSNAFLVLGRQICASRSWSEWFETDPLCQGQPAKWRSPFPNSFVYRLYVAWFNHWAKLLGVPASQLEQFVFGWDRRGVGNQWWNPRNQLIALGQSQFCSGEGKVEE